MSTNEKLTRLVVKINKLTQDGDLEWHVVGGTNKDLVDPRDLTYFSEWSGLRLTIERKWVEVEDEIKTFSIGAFGDKDRRYKTVMSCHFTVINAQAGEKMTLKGGSATSDLFYTVINKVSTLDQSIDRLLSEE